MGVVQVRVYENGCEPFVHSLRMQFSGLRLINQRLLTWSLAPAPGCSNGGRDASVPMLWMMSTPLEGMFGSEDSGQPNDEAHVGEGKLLSCHASSRVGEPDHGPAYRVLNPSSLHGPVPALGESMSVSHCRQRGQGYPESPTDEGRIDACCRLLITVASLQPPASRGRSGAFGGTSGRRQPIRLGRSGLDCQGPN